MEGRPALDQAETASLVREQNHFECRNARLCSDSQDGKHVKKIFSLLFAPRYTGLREAFGAKGLFRFFKRA